MSKQYINKHDAIERVTDTIIERFDIGLTEAYAIAEEGLDLPVADVKPIDYSRWVLGGYDDMFYVCEKCGHRQSQYFVKPKVKFCPECGAKIVEVKEE